MEIKIRYYLEFQIKKLYDIQKLPGVLIDALTPYLHSYGAVVDAMPHYGNPKDECLTTISLEDKTLHLQYIKGGVVLYNLEEGIKCIQNFVCASNLEGLCRLKFKSDHYNLLNDHAV